MHRETRYRALWNLLFSLGLCEIRYCKFEFREVNLTWSYPFLPGYRCAACGRFGGQKCRSASATNSVKLLPRRSRRRNFGGRRFRANFLRF